MSLCQHCLLEDTCWTPLDAPWNTLVGREICLSERHLQSTKYLIVFINFFQFKGPKKTPESYKFFDLNLSFHLNNPHQPLSEVVGVEQRRIHFYLRVDSLFTQLTEHEQTVPQRLTSHHLLMANLNAAKCIGLMLLGHIRKCVIFCVTQVKCWILKECDHSHPFVFLLFASIS